MNHELRCLETHSGETDPCHNQKIASLRAVVLQILKIVTRLFITSLFKSCYRSYEIIKKGSKD